MVLSCICIVVQAQVFLQMRVIGSQHALRHFDFREVLVRRVLEEGLGLHSRRAV